MLHKTLFSVLIYIYSEHRRDETSDIRYCSCGSGSGGGGGRVGGYEENIRVRIWQTAMKKKKLFSLTFVKGGCPDIRKNISNINVIQIFVVGTLP